MTKKFEQWSLFFKLFVALIRVEMSQPSSSGTGSPATSRTSGYASHAIRHKSRFGGYIRGLEIKVQSCVDQGDEDETRECGLTVRPQTHYVTNEVVFGDVCFEES